MKFSENLEKKIRIDNLSEKVSKSIGPIGSMIKVDKEAMRRLLGMGPFMAFHERDLELYIKTDEIRFDVKRILVLDNELPVYKTSIKDVLLRRSPTIKEMVNIRNAIKILSDKDVMMSKKKDSLSYIHIECVKTLDLMFEIDDIRNIKQSASDSFEIEDCEGVVKGLDLFGELLKSYRPTFSFNTGDYVILGELSKSSPEKQLISSVIVYDPSVNNIILIDELFDLKNRDSLTRFQNIIKNFNIVNAKGRKVFDQIEKMVIKRFKLEPNVVKNLLDFQ